jgi:hypothetical protein
MSVESAPYCAAVAKVICVTCPIRQVTEAAWVATQAGISDPDPEQAAGQLVEKLAFAILDPADPTDPDEREELLRGGPDEVSDDEFEQALADQARLGVTEEDLSVELSPDRAVVGILELHGWEQVDANWDEPLPPTGQAIGDCVLRNLSEPCPEFDYKNVSPFKGIVRMEDAARLFDTVGRHGPPGEVLKMVSQVNRWLGEYGRQVPLLPDPSEADLRHFLIAWSGILLEHKEELKRYFA